MSVWVETDTKVGPTRRPKRTRVRFLSATRPHLHRHGHETDGRDARLLLSRPANGDKLNITSSSHQQPAHPAAPPVAAAAQFQCPGQLSAPTYLPRSTPPSNVAAATASPHRRRNRLAPPPPQHPRRRCQHHLALFSRRRPCLTCVSKASAIVHKASKASA